MRHVLRVAEGLLVLLVLGVLTAALFFSWKAQQDRTGSDVFQSPIKTPLPSPRVGTPWYTPDLTQEVRRGTRTPKPSEFGTPPVVAAPSVTPRPISRIVDLAPELPERDKATVYVRHPDGTYGLFLINYNMNISELPLRTGDVVTKVVPPASLVGHKPPELPGSPFDSPLATPTNSPTVGVTPEAGEP